MKKIIILLLALMVAFTFISCDEPEAPHEHKWDEGKVTTEATCTEAGVKTYTCACGETKEEPIPAKGHTFSEAWEKDETNHWHKCTIEGCTGISDKLAHTFSDWHLNADNTKLIIDCTACGYVKDEKEVTVASTEQELGEAIAAKKPCVALLEDIEVTKQTDNFVFDYDFFIDLNGKTLTLNNNFSIIEANAVINNGSLNVNYDETLDKNAIQLFKNSSLELNKVTMESNVGGIFAVNNEDNVSLKLNESTVKAHGYYGLGTNATVPSAVNVTFEITKSTIIVENTEETAGSDAGDNTGILFNVNGQVIIKDSNIKAGGQGIILRTGGTEENKPHMITGTIIEATGENKKPKDYINETWGGGNNIPLAALVIGNRSTGAYALGTTVVLNNVELKAPEKNTVGKEYFDMFIYQNNETYPVSVTLTGAKPSRINEDMNDAIYHNE